MRIIFNGFKAKFELQTLKRRYQNFIIWALLIAQFLKALIIRIVSKFQAKLWYIFAHVLAQPLWIPIWLSHSAVRQENICSGMRSNMHSGCLSHQGCATGFRDTQNTKNKFFAVRIRTMVYRWLMHLFRLIINDCVCVFRMSVCVSKISRFAAGVYAYVTTQKRNGCVFFYFFFRVKFKKECYLLVL